MISLTSAHSLDFSELVTTLTLLLAWKEMQKSKKSESREMKLVKWQGFGYKNKQVYMRKLMLRFLSITTLISLHLWVHSKFITEKQSLFFLSISIYHRFQSIL